MNIHEILELAILAPSGDNCQPWNFVINDNRIDIFNLPERDISLFNFRQRASLVAHGALIENIVIASSASGYNAIINAFPDKTKPDLVATVVLEEAAGKDEPLYPYIPIRSTNRKRYTSVALTNEERSALINASISPDTGQVKLTENQDEKAVLSRLIGRNDSIVFSNIHLHKFLFDHVRWSDQEARETRDGLDLKTLELSLPDSLGFKLLRHWPVVNIMNKFGLVKVIAKNAERLGLSSSAIGAVIVCNNTVEDFLSGGRLVQRVWLEATRMGLNFQPMTGMTFLIQKVLCGDTEGLSQGQIETIRKAHKEIKTVFRLDRETIVMIFRVGHSGPPTERSLRMPLKSMIKRHSEGA